MDDRKRQSLPYWRYGYGETFARREPERTELWQSPLINTGIYKMQYGSLERDLSKKSLMTGVVSVEAPGTQMAASTSSTIG